MLYLFMRELIIYQDNFGLWIAESQEIPGYRAKGATREEAMEKLKTALLLYNPCKCEDSEE